MKCHLFSFCEGPKQGYITGRQLPILMLVIGFTRFLLQTVGFSWRTRMCALMWVFGWVFLHFCITYDCACAWHDCRQAGAALFLLQEDVSG